MQVYVKILVFAFVVVAANTVILAAFMLYGLNLKDTWTWTDAFLFATMIASTDAVAVTAIMKQGMTKIACSLHIIIKESHAVSVGSKTMHST